MNIDLFAVINGILGFFLYLIIKVTVFRIFKGRQIMKWVINSFFVSLPLQCSLFFGMVYKLNLPIPNPGISAAAFLISVSITGLMIVCYILAVFGIATTSLRIQLLVAIAEKKENKVRDSEIRRQYGSKMIVRQRLERFLESGEVNKINNAYVISSRKTFFMRYTEILTVINKLYKNPIYRNII